MNLRKFMRESWLGDLREFWQLRKMIKWVGDFRELHLRQIMTFS
uniref:Uncharacterized protein n=1 Tax=Nymphaea colorata TaxID=210225 RepID=A0A5K0ZRB1_9MAGN